jgi:hypothetical protein
MPERAVGPVLPDAVPMVSELARDSISFAWATRPRLSSISALISGARSTRPSFGVWTGSCHSVITGVPTPRTKSALGARTSSTAVSPDPVVAPYSVVHSIVSMCFSFVLWTKGSRSESMDIEVVREEVELVDLYDSTQNVMTEAHLCRALPANGGTVEGGSLPLCQLALDCGSSSCARRFRARIRSVLPVCIEAARRPPHVPHLQFSG